MNIAKHIQASSNHSYATLYLERIEQQLFLFRIFHQLRFLELLPPDLRTIRKHPHDFADTGKIDY